MGAFGAGSYRGTVVHDDVGAHAPEVDFTVEQADRRRPQGSVMGPTGQGSSSLAPPPRGILGPASG